MKKTEKLKTGVAENRSFATSFFSGIPVSRDVLTVGIRLQAISFKLYFKGFTTSTMLAKFIPFMT